jgi:hypothetical protein
MLFYTRVHSRILRAAMAPAVPAAPACLPSSLRHFHAAEAAVNFWCDEAILPRRKLDSIDKNQVGQGIYHISNRPTERRYCG